MVKSLQMISENKTLPGLEKDIRIKPSDIYLKYLILFFLLCFYQILISQNELELRTDGIVLPGMDTSHISVPTAGQVIFDSISQKLAIYTNSGHWHIMDDANIPTSQDLLWIQNGDSINSISGAGHVQIGEHGVPSSADLHVNGQINGQSMSVSDTVLHTTNTGKVGIGTDSPVYQLHLKGQFPKIRLESSQALVPASAEIEFGGKSSTGGYESTGVIGMTGSSSHLSISGHNGVAVKAGFAERLRIDDSGKIGVNTSIPTALFEIKSNGTDKPFMITPQVGNEGELLTILNTGLVGLGTNNPQNDRLVLWGETESTSSLSLINASTLFPKSIHIDFRNENNIPMGEIKSVTADNQSGDLHLKTSNNQILSTKVFIQSDGDVGIGTESPDQKLHVVGNVKIEGVGSGPFSSSLNLTPNGVLTTSTSDRRLKENIVDITTASEKVMSLRGVYFNWKSDTTKERRLGVIAQEVEEVVPELVFTNSVDGYLGVRYEEIVPLLIEAFKEQQSTIEFLKEQITSLTHLKSEK